MSKRKNKWFKKVRGSYLPSSWQGWLTYIPFIFLLVGSVILTKVHTSSDWYIILQVFADWVTIAVVMTWFASIKSK
jgi:hypothetical protein